MIYKYCEMITTTGLVHIHHLMDTGKENKNSPCDETSLILLMPPAYLSSVNHRYRISPWY